MLQLLVRLCAPKPTTKAPWIVIAQGCAISQLQLNMVMLAPLHAGFSDPQATAHTQMHQNRAMAKLYN
jgi:hypothetical protein